MIDHPEKDSMRRRVTYAAEWCGLTCVFVLLALMAARPLAHDDLFFHLRTGDLILRTGSVPHADSYSHTMPGAPWTTHEWGFAILVALVFRSFGYSGLVGLTSVLAVVAFALVYALMRRLAGGRTFACVPLLIVAILGAARPGFILRAALLSTVALALLQYLLHVHHARPRRSTGFAIVALFFFWANVHVGAVLGFSVLGAYWVQVTADRWRASVQRGLRALVHCALNSAALLGVTCVLVTLANANTVKLWTFPFELNAIYYHSGMEWTLNMFEPPLPATQPFFFLGVATLMVACLPLRAFVALVSHSGHAMLMQALCAAFYAAMALRSTRFIPDFFIVALPLCAARWGALLPRSETPARKRMSDAWLHAGGVVVALVTAAALRPSVPADPISDFFPKSAVAFMQREHIRGRMLNFMNWGGYLGWRLNTTVYWDGRNDVFWPLVKEYNASTRVGDLLEQHRIDMLVAELGTYEAFKDYLAAHAKTWSLIYFDDRAAVYLKNDGPFSPKLLAQRYRLLQPFAFPSPEAIRALSRDPALVSRLEAEIARAHEQGGDGYIATGLRSALKQARGQLSSAVNARQ
jgi:hypothetical protein